MANLAARRKIRNAARFENRQQQRQPTSVSRDSKIDTRQALDPDGIDASNSCKLEHRRVKAEKEMAALGNEALILVYGYNPNLYEDVFVLPPNSSNLDIQRSYQEQTSQLEHSLATVFTSDLPDDEINATLTYSQMQAAISCGMTSAHMEKMHPRNFMEVKMDALKRAFDILKDEQSRIEYDAVLLEFQESSRRKLTAVVELDEDEEDEEEYEEIDRDIDYGEHGDYSYEEKDVEEAESDNDDQLSTNSADSSEAEKTVQNDEEPNHGPSDDEPNNEVSYPQSPSQALAKHPWKQEQPQEQHSPRDPFDFEEQFYQPTTQEDYTIMTSRSTRSVHADLFDPFDLQGADQINFNHLPMVDQLEDGSIYTEETEQDKHGEETVTVFQYPLPEADDKEEYDDGDDITVGKVIEARERGEDVVLPQRTTYPDMVDFVPREKKGFRPKLRSLYQSVKRSVGGGSSKGSRSITSDSAEFQSRGVRVISLTPPKKKNDNCNNDPPQAKSEMIDPQGPNLSAEESDDEETEYSRFHQEDSDDDDDDDYGDEEGSVMTDFISDLTRDTLPCQQQQTPQPKTQQPQQVVSTNTDLEVKTFLDMANNFRAMAMNDEANNNTDEKSEKFDNDLLYNNSNRNSSMPPTQKNGRTVPTNDCIGSSSSNNKKDDYLKHYPMKSLVSVDDESEDDEDDKTAVEAIMDEWIGVIDEIEEMFDDSLESISSVLSCED